jgi:hypothetical protein
MFGLARRISGSEIIGATAALCYMLLPTVINGAHEAKPHLAGAVLGLIAVDMAIRAIESGRWRWVVATGAACGAAASMVLSGWLAIGLLPVMAFFMSTRTATPSAQPGRAGTPPRPPHPNPALPGWAKSDIPIRQMIAVTVISCATAILVYALCNPYVIIHLLGDRTVLQSNIENSTAMYQAPPSLDGIVYGLLLLMEGGSATVFLGMWAIAIPAWRKESIAWLLLAVTVPGLCVFLMHATGKPGEYGRFAMPLDVLCVVGVTVGLSIFRHTGERVALGSVLVLMLLPFAAPYVLSYGRETLGGSTRLIVAARLQQLSSAGAATLAVDAEPAPYTLPPVDLFRWKLVLLPRGTAMPADADVRIDPVDVMGKDRGNISYLVRPILSPVSISWAGKPFRIETRPGDVAGAKGQR